MLAAGVWVLAVGVLGVVCVGDVVWGVVGDWLLPEELFAPGPPVCLWLGVAWGVLPLLLLGLLSRETLLRWRARLDAAGKTGKIAMGVILAAVGALIISGLDKKIETVLVDLSPAWLTELTTHF